ncbi:hypothetical protein KEM54_001770 [Ascosphaera aggregata]|nr:hypothetical protein KEM54_001770 [Ascosphaera aggregata]
MSSEPSLFQSLYRKYAPVFSSRAYTPLAANDPERHTWDIEDHKSINNSRSLPEGGEEEEDDDGDDDGKPYPVGRRPSINNLKFTPYRDIVNDRDDLNFGHLSNFTPEPEKIACWENWYLIVTAALLIFHHETAISLLAEHISKTRETDDDGNYFMTAMRRIEDACLKTAVFVGLPRATTALSSLSSVVQIPVEEKDNVVPSVAGDKPSSKASGSDRGCETSERIHGTEVDEALDIINIDCGKDNCTSTIRTMYGIMLSDTGVLNTLETVMIAFAACLADNMPAQAQR